MSGLSVLLQKILIHTHECTLLSIYSKLTYNAFIAVLMRIFLITTLLGTSHSSSTASFASHIPSTLPFTAACPGKLCLFPSLHLKIKRHFHYFSDSSEQLSVHFFSTRSSAGSPDAARGRRAAPTRRPPPSSAPRAGWTPAASPPAPRCPRSSPPPRVTPVQTQTGSSRQISD